MNIKPHIRVSSGYSGFFTTFFAILRWHPLTKWNYNVGSDNRFLTTNKFGIWSKLWIANLLNLLKSTLGAEHPCGSKRQVLSAMVCYAAAASVCFFHLPQWDQSASALLQRAVQYRRNVTSDHILAPPFCLPSSRSVYTYTELSKIQLAQRIMRFRLCEYWNTKKEFWIPLISICILKEF